jgi:hypothetical protein
MLLNGAAQIEETATQFPPIALLHSVIHFVSGFSLTYDLLVIHLACFQFPLVITADAE